MEPAKPPFPTARNFPFQLDAGSHSSILIRESDVGLRVISTRQCAGMLAGGGAGTGGAPPSRWPPRAPPRAAPGAAARAGGGPSGTTAALVMVASENLIVVRLSQGGVLAAA